MKISELAKASDTSIPTLKFYIRKGLLPPGGTTSRTQANYTDVHLRRLELISILQADLGMTVEKIGEVLREAVRGGEAMLAMGLKNAGESRHGSRGAARKTRRGSAGARVRSDAVSPESGRAWSLVYRMAKSLRWELQPKDPMANDVAEAVATILRAMPEARIDRSLIEYARAMKSIADREIPDSFDPAGEPWESLRYAVLGTYLLEPLILALRRLAHAERTARLYRIRKRKRKSPRLPKAAH
ncbi:MAG: MerR family transcriptional regulator [Fibrobacteria bacterium]